jgi:hypothetical protein
MWYHSCLSVQPYSTSIPVFQDDTVTGCVVPKISNECSDFTVKDQGKCTKSTHPVTQHHDPEDTDLILTVMWPLFYGRNRSSCYLLPIK